MPAGIRFEISPRVRSPFDGKDSATKDLKEFVAETMNTYLIGVRARDNPMLEDGSMREYGPFRKDPGTYNADDHWQLDRSNDFWLHFEPSGLVAYLNYRYPGKQEAMARAMVQMFTLRYGDDEQVKAAA